MSSAESGETLAGLGEFAVIGRITARRTQPAEVVVGPGDDAALLTAADGRVVVSTDMLVEGRHFRLDWSTPHDVGRKAIAQNAADIEAMGGRPYAFVVGFGAPAHTEAADAQRLSDGMWSEATKFGAGIVGGDLVAAPQWVVSVTVLGDLGGRQPVLLSGAQSGDTVAVIGDLGWSGAGYALWRKGIHEFDELRRRHLVPHVRYGQGAARDWVLGGGEDHVLVGTFGGALPAGWRAIGTVRPGEPRVTVDGASWHGAGGWESFGQ